MEKGVIRSINSHDNIGTIADEQGKIINFNSSHIVDKDRTALKMGDNVWFEKLGIDLDIKAINIRRC